MFDDDCSDIANQTRLQTIPRSNLSFVLANGLRRCLKKASERGKHRYAEPEVSDVLVFKSPHVTQLNVVKTTTACRLYRMHPACWIAQPYSFNDVVLLY